LIAITNFFTIHIAPERSGTLPEALDELRRECHRLHQQAIERWGSDDPHPDKW